jgi:predicted DNA-binding protein (MmcQ/YjbR family)
MSEDKRLARLSKLCLALPEAERELASRHARFHVRDKTFAWFLDDHHGDGIVSVSCKMALGENREVAALDPARFYLPAYMTHRGWIAMRLDTGTIDWGEVEELVSESYRLVAPRRLAAIAGKTAAPPRAKAAKGRAPR